MKAAVSCKNVTKRYAGFSLENLNLEIPAGTIVGFVGENGAGKTTTIKSILNLVQPEQGSITVLGEDSRRLSRSTKEKIGVVFDGCHLPQELKTGQVEKILAAMYSKWDAACFQRLAGKFRLDKEKRVKELSRGMQMKLAIAAALSHQPELLLLDEATSGLDPMVRDEILDIFLEFLQEEKNTILLSSHIISDIEKVADYVAFIHRGRLVFMEEKDLLKDTYGLVSCRKEEADQIPEDLVAGSRTSAFNTTLLIRGREEASKIFHREVPAASMEDIMLYLSKGDAR